MNTPDERKVTLALYKLSGYALSWWDYIQFDRIRQGKDTIHSWPRMKKMISIKFYPWNYDEILSCTKQDYQPKSSYLVNYFEEPYSRLREELHVEENIRFYREINENLIKEDLEIEIVEKINEHPIIEKDIKVEIVETRKEKIEDKIVNDLSEIKSKQVSNSYYFGGRH